MALLLGPEPIVDAQPWYPPKLQEFAPAEALAAGLVCQADAVEIGYTTEADAGTTADDPGRSLSIVSLDRLRQAIRDPDLDRGHLKVLANLSERFNATTLTAWPSRERIGEEEGLDPKSVANKLYDLKRRGYIDWGRLPDPKKSRRTLVHYWWLQDEIAAAVTTIREKIDAQSARPAGQQKCPPERASAKSARPSGKESARSAGLESARPAGNKELSLAGTHLAEENTPPSPRKRRAKRGREYLFEEIIEDLKIAGHPAHVLDAFILPVSNSLEVRHPSPRGLFEQTCKLLARYPVHFLEIAARQMALDRKVWVSVKDLSEPISKGLQLVKQWHITREMPEHWAAWKAYHLANTGGGNGAGSASYCEKTGHFSELTEWPPGHRQLSAAEVAT